MRREEIHDTSSLVRVCVEPRSRFGDHPGMEGSIGKGLFARSNLGKSGIDPPERRAHLAMNVLEYRAGSNLFFGRRKDVP
jgi:hypothetical protein